MKLYVYTTSQTFCEEFAEGILWKMNKANVTVTPQVGDWFAMCASIKDTVDPRRDAEEIRFIELGMTLRKYRNVSNKLDYDSRKGKILAIARLSKITGDRMLMDFEFDYTHPLQNPITFPGASMIIDLDGPSINVDNWQQKRAENAKIKKLVEDQILFQLIK